jgi:hypothetical protein
LPWASAGLGIDQFLQGRQQLGLAEDLAGPRRRACPGLVGVVVRQERPPRVRPLFQDRAPAFDVLRLRFLDRVALGHLHRRRQHLRQAEPAVLGDHHHQPARGARGDRGQRPVFRRIHHALLAEEFRGRAGGRHAQRVDALHLAGMRVVDQRLGLAAPTERVPHRGGDRQHRRGGIHCVAAALEHHRAGGRALRLAGHRHPVLGQDRRSRGALRMHRARQPDGRDQDGCQAGDEPARGLGGEEMRHGLLPEIQQLQPSVLSRESLSQEPAVLNGAKDALSKQIPRLRSE